MQCSLSATAALLPCCQSACFLTRPVCLRVYVLFARVRITLQVGALDKKLDLILSILPKHSVELDANMAA